MSSLNKIILIGNLGKNPEVRFTADGAKVCTFSLATSESWKDKSTGERQSKTEWHKVVIFNPLLCDMAENYLKKGSKVFIEGSIQTRKWAGKDGAEKETTEVVVSKFKGEMVLLDKKESSEEVPF